MKLSHSGKNSELLLNSDLLLSFWNGEMEKANVSELVNEDGTITLEALIMVDVKSRKVIARQHFEPIHMREGDTLEINWRLDHVGVDLE